MAKEKKNRGRLLYAASTLDHIKAFHLDYIAALRNEGYTVDVMARGVGADIDVPFEKRMFSLKNLRCIGLIKRAIKHGKYDAILVNTTLAAFFVRASLPKRQRPKTVNFVHGYLFGERDVSPKAMLFLLAEVFLRQKTDAIIVMNGEDLRIAKKHRLTKGKIFLVRGMGVSLRGVITPPEALRAELFPKNAYILTFVGELSKRKNQGLLIDALNIIKMDVPTSILCLVGDGKERKRLASRARALGISDRVFFTGHRQDACDLIRASDVYVSASKSEGLPFNLVEALGIGKTVIASRIKGHRDLIDDGIDGFLYDPGCAEQLAAMVIDEYRGKLSTSPKKIEEKFLKYEKSSVLPETLSVIREAIR